MKLNTRALIAISILAISVAAQERYVKPVDEAGRDPSFAAFRTKLIAAAERRDSAYILQVVDPKIELSFGGDHGIADFNRIWRINAKDSKFWGEFLPVIKNGGLWIRNKGKRTGTFFAPYSFNGFPEDLDAFEYAVIFGNNVNLRKTASPDGEIVGRLSYNVVKPHYPNFESDTAREGRSSDWIKVETLGGMTGYVNSAFVRSPIDYRAGFEKKRGVWKLVTFIAGD